MLPSVTDILSRSVALYRAHWKLFLQYTIVGFLPLLILSFVAGLSVNYTPGPVAGIILFLALLVAGVVSVWFSLALVRIMARVYQGQPVGTMGNEIGATKKLIVPAILASILVGLAVLGGFILLIIPGIIFAIWFVFSFYAVAIDGQKAVASLSFSKQLVKGRWFEIFWRLFGPAIVFGLMAFIPQSIVEFIFAILKQGMGNGAGALVIEIIGIIISFAISLLLAPLTTTAQTILYVEAKKQPMPSAAPQA